MPRSVAERVKEINAILDSDVGRDEVIEALKGLAADADPDVAAAAIEGLGMHRASSNDIVRLLVRQSTNEDRNVRSNAVAALGRAGAPSDEVRRAIVCRLRDAEYRVRASAYFSLGATSDASREVMDALTASWSSGSSRERAAIAVAIEDLGDCSDGMRALLASGLNAQEWILRLHCFKALAGLDSVPEPLVAQMQALSNDENERVRTAVKAWLAGE